jgi:hypothetical protein
VNSLLLFQCERDEDGLGDDWDVLLARGGRGICTVSLASVGEARDVNMRVHSIRYN